MRNVVVASLFASAIHAQSEMTYLNLMWYAEPTLTLMSSDAIATTFERICPTTTTTTSTSTSTSNSPDSFPMSFGSEEQYSSALSSWFANPSVQNYFSTYLPATTPATEADHCIPFTLFQGPETWGFHLTYPIPGALTKNGNCTWTGAFTEVPITCDGELRGSAYDTELPSGRTYVMGQEELRTYSELRFAVATVVVASPTPTPTGGAKTTGEAARSAASGAEAKSSSGLAVGLSHPNGLIAMVGGMAAAAWGLQ